MEPYIKQDYVLSTEENVTKVLQESNPIYPLEAMAWYSIISSSRYLHITTANNEN